MKKILLMMAVATMMVACGNKQQAKAEPAKENAEQTGPYKFSVANHITGTTGSTNCFLADLGSDIAFEVSGEGDSLDVAATVKIKHTDKTEVKKDADPAELWISGRQDDNGDTKVKFFADEENQKKLVEWFDKPAGTEVEVTFKGKAAKKDLDQLNGKECTNTLVL